MVISENAQFEPGTYEINGADSLDQAVITIQGENLVLDFEGAVLKGSNDQTEPHQFYGLGISIKDSKNITIKNLTARGYKVALFAENVDSLVLINCDFSYNFRQKLKSVREREDLSDWLSYHNNEADEWLRYGAGVYLKNCAAALVRDVTITGGQNGLMMTNCNHGLFYNNTIHFNSGIGIGLYRSSDNQIMHNKLDWNVRGYSHGFYQRGQDSAGILCYEQSSRNTFAYNSATHSGDGFFLWAGQQTMDSGAGGCNDNLIYKNDFSHAPTNGIEVTFSSNKIIQNRLEECRYGVWAGYSYETLITENDIKNNEFGVAFEHGNNNRIEDNLFEDNKFGIQLWERDRQPDDWGFAQKRDVTSRNYQILSNLFIENRYPLKISHTDSVIIQNNTFNGFLKTLVEDENANLVMDNNQIKGYIDSLNRPEWEPLDSVPPLADGMDALLPEHHLRGRQYMLINEWGPYDFRYPVIWLREIQKDSTYVFLLLGPQGNWKAVDGNGFVSVNPKSGTFPATLTAKRDASSEDLQIKLEFIGEAVTTQFGEQLKRGTVIPFTFERFEKPLEWTIDWFNYADKEVMLQNTEGFSEAMKAKPVATQKSMELAYTWWYSPAEGVDPNQFATLARSSFESEPGQYKFILNSDDGVRLWLDGELLVDHWDIHVPATDEVMVELGGKHELEIQHFEGGGFATLSFRIEKIIDEVQ